MRSCWPLVRVWQCDPWLICDVLRVHAAVCGTLLRVIVVTSAVIFVINVNKKYDNERTTIFYSWKSCRRFRKRFEGSRNSNRYVEIRLVLEYSRQACTVQGSRNNFQWLCSLDRTEIQSYGSRSLMNVLEISTKLSLAPVVYVVYDFGFRVGARWNVENQQTSLLLSYG